MNKLIVIFIWISLLLERHRQTRADKEKENEQINKKANNHGMINYVNYFSQL